MGGFVFPHPGSSSKPVLIIQSLNIDKTKVLHIIPID